MSVPNRAARCGSSIAANSANWVNSSALSPSARISSQISSSRITLPDRAPTADRSCNSSAGWLHTCLSLAIAASTLPRRSIPAVFSIFSIMSSTTDWYSDACSVVSRQYCLISIFSGRSLMIAGSVFSRRSTYGRVMTRSRSAGSVWPCRSTGMA